MPQELLLNFKRRTGFAQQRAVLVAEGMPADATKTCLRGCPTPATMDWNPRVLVLGLFHPVATLTRPGSALRASQQAPSRPPDPVLLQRRGVIAPTRDVARKSIAIPRINQAVAASGQLAQGG